MSSRLLSSAFALLLGGCGTLGAASYTFDTRAVAATPPAPMVAHKLDTPLFIVLDPAQVPDTWQLARADGEHYTLVNFRAFVARDLRAAMSHYFERVEVVAPGQLPSRPHVEAMVRIDKLALHSRDTPAYDGDYDEYDTMTYTTIEMTWAFSLRASGATDNAFSYATVSHSKDAYPTFVDGCAQLFEDAIGDMLASWNGQGGLAALRVARR